jgi:hypothetical protein
VLFFPKKNFYLANDINELQFVHVTETMFLNLAYIYKNENDNHFCIIQSITEIIEEKKF